MFPMPPDPRPAASTQSARSCREQARKLFAQAIAETNPKTREILLQSGEHWMLRSRYWPSV